MEATLRYSLADASGKVVAMDDAEAHLGQDELVIAPSSGETRLFSLRDIVSIEEVEYHLTIQLRPADSLMLFNIGYKFEDFARELFRSANDLELRDLLMDERLLKQGVRGDFALTSAGERKEMGRCEIRLYQTAIVVLPEHAQLHRARFADVTSTEVKDYWLLVHLEGGDVLGFGKLGRELDPLRKGIMDASAGLSAQVQRMVKDAHPGADSEGVAKAAKLLKEGRPAGRQELEDVCPGLWQGLEKKVAGFGIGEEFTYLTGMAREGGVRIGVKRSLHGESEEDYIFFLAPIYSTDRSKGGNVVAFEASSGEDEGRATYFFRIWGRKEYPMVGWESMAREADRFVTSLASGLNAINFRREPIYLAEESLHAPEHSRYRFAIQRIPELRLLRERFVGRVMHSTPEQWKEDVRSLLDFNVAQKGDAAKWVKADEGQ